MESKNSDPHSMVPAPESDPSDYVQYLTDKLNKITQENIHLKKSLSDTKELLDTTEDLQQKAEEARIFAEENLRNLSQSGAAISGNFAAEDAMSNAGGDVKHEFEKEQLKQMQEQLKQAMQANYDLKRTSSKLEKRVKQLEAELGPGSSGNADAATAVGKGYKHILNGIKKRIFNEADNSDNRQPSISAAEVESELVSELSKKLEDAHAELTKTNTEFIDLKNDLKLKSQKLMEMRAESDAISVVRDKYKDLLSKAELVVGDKARIIKDLQAELRKAESSNNLNKFDNVDEGARQEINLLHSKLKELESNETEIASHLRTNIATFRDILISDRLALEESLPKKFRNSSPIESLESTNFGDNSMDLLKQLSNIISDAEDELGRRRIMILDARVRSKNCSNILLDLAPKLGIEDMSLDGDAIYSFSEKLHKSLDAILLENNRLSTMVEKGELRTNEEIQNVLAEKEAFIKEKQELDEQLACESQKNLALQKELDSKDLTISKLNKSLESSNQEIRSLQVASEALEKDHAQHQEEIDHLKARIADFENEKEILESTAHVNSQMEEEMRFQFDKVKEELESVKKDFDTFKIKSENDADELRFQKDEISRNYEKLSDERQSSLEQKESLERKADESAREKAEACKEVEKLRSQLSMKNEEMASLTSEVQALNSELENKKFQLSALDKESDSCRDELKSLINKLQDEINLKVAEISAYQNKCRENEKEHEKLKVSNANLQAENEQLIIEADSLKNRLQNSENDIGESETIKKELVSQIEKLQSSIDQHQKFATEQKQTLAERESQIQRIQVQKDDVLQKLKMEELRNVELSSELQSSKKQISHFQKELELQSSVSTEPQTEVSTLERQLLHLQKINAKVKQELAMSDEKVFMLTKNENDLKKTIVNIQKDLEEEKFTHQETLDLVSDKRRSLETTQKLLESNEKELVSAYRKIDHLEDELRVQKRDFKKSNELVSRLEAESEEITALYGKLQVDQVSCESRMRRFKSEHLSRLDDLSQAVMDNIRRYDLKINGCARRVAAVKESVQNMALGRKHILEYSGKSRNSAFSKISVLSESLDQAQAQVDNKQRQIDTLRIERDDLFVQLNQANYELSSKVDELNTLTTKYKGLESEKNEMNEHLATCQDKIVKLQGSLTHEKHALSSSKDSHKIEVEGFQKELERLKNKLADKSKYVEELERQLSTKDQSASLSRSESLSMGSKLSNAESQIKNLKESIETKTLIIQDLSSKLNEISNEKQNIELNFQNENEKLVNFEEERQSLLEEIRRKELAIERMSNELVKLKDEMMPGYGMSAALAKEDSDRLSKLEEENRSLKESTEALNTEIDTLRANFAVIESRLQTSDSENVELSEQLQNSKQELLEEKSKITEFQEKIFNLEKNLETLRIGESETSMNTVELKRTLDSLTDDLQESNKALTDALNSKIQLEAQIEEKNAEIDHLIDQKKTSSKYVEQLMESCSLKDDEINSLAELVTENQTKIVKLNEELSKYHDGIEKSNGGNLRFEVEGLKSKIMLIEAEKANMAITHRKSQSELENMQQCLSDYEKSLEMKDSEIKQLKLDLENKTAETVVVNLQIKELNEKLQSVESEKEAVRSSLHDLEKRSENALNNLREELAEVTKQYTHYENMTVDLRQVNDELCQNLSSAKEDLNDAKKQIIAHEDKIDQLQQQIETAESNNMSSEQKISQLTETIADYEIRLSKIQSRKTDEQRQETEKLRNQLKEALNEKQNMVASMEKLTESYKKHESSRKQLKKMAHCLQLQMDEKISESQKLNARIAELEKSNRYLRSKSHQ